MAQVDDAKLNKIETALVATGHVDDLEVLWLQSLDVSVTSDDADTAWHQYWDSQAVAAGNFNDRAYAWLGSLLHTGSLSDRWLSYWSS